MISRIPTRLKVNAGPAYNSSNWVRRRLSSDIITVIDVCLEENETRRLEGWGKQQLREVDIHEKILRAGHCISYTIVREYIRIGKLQVRETFIRQGNGEGSICEFDWAEVKIKIGGIYRRYCLAVFISAFSNYRYVKLFQRQDSLAFKEAHINFFEPIGGVYNQTVYDNIRVAVARFVGLNEKLPTEALVHLSCWYQFQCRFCNTAKGNKKGHVERRVEYVRCEVFGFNLMQNFNRPLLAKSVTELGRKWHIALSTWFADYFYNPIAIAKRALGNWSNIYASFTTFIVLGFWHGTNWTFIVFGLLQGLILTIEFLPGKQEKIFAKKFLPF